MVIVSQGFMGNVREIRFYDAADNGDKRCVSSCFCVADGLAFVAIADEPI